MNENLFKRPKRKIKRGEFMFYVGVLAFPVVQFCIFYIFVNFNSLLLAFQKYDFDSGKYIFAGFDNLKQFINDLTAGTLLRTAIKNSLILYVFGILTGLFLSLLFSYYIYKKFRFSNVFRVILVMPSLISSIVLVIVFRYVIDELIPGLANAIFHQKIESPMSHPTTRFAMIVFFNLWVGFGSGIILYSGAMSQIDASVIEYGQIDGVTPLKEFWHIVLPLIYPILSTFLVTGVAGIFTNQAHIYSFYQDVAIPEVFTLGYFLFQRVISRSASLSSYPYAAAAGLLFTLIAVPVTLAVKRVLERYGPSPESRARDKKKGSAL